MQIRALGCCLLSVSVLLVGASQSASAAEVIIHAGHLIADAGKPSTPASATMAKRGFMKGGKTIRDDGHDRT
jgi:hypothetical protein